jgi:hypothetical protein
MPKDDTEDKLAILKRELGGRGYVIHLSTAKEGGNLVARLEVSEAATEKNLVRLVSVAKVDDLNLLVGVDAPEGVLKEFLAQVFGFADALRELVPAVTIHEE